MQEIYKVDNPPVWFPDTTRTENANLTHFMRLYEIYDYEELWERSVHDVAWFTDAVLKFLDIRFKQPYTRVMDTSQGSPWTRWCVDGRMNIVDNCLEKFRGTPIENQPALIWEGEEGSITRLSYLDLRILVNQAANGMRSLGLHQGDVVGLYLPMIPETVISLLAVAKIGAIILPLFSGYGPSALTSRLQDSTAKAIITADGFSRRGKPITMKPFADLAAEEVPSINHIIVVERTNLPVHMQPLRDFYWHELITSQPEEANTADTLAEDPLMLIYTSGTTGKPKGTVHTHCSFPVKAAQDMAFGTDVHTGEVVHWITDIGWMMGPWLIFGSLLLGATMFLSDGAPDYPAPDQIWTLVERHKIAKLGLSPSYVRSIIPAGKEIVQAHDLSSLDLIASTGEPWNPDPWTWLFEVVGKKKVPIINYTGGTELSGGILMSNPLLPIKPCAFNAPCPGMAADVFDEHGRSVHKQVGELVIKAPWIGMTRGFWHDPERYLETYWSRWPDVWVHGDWAVDDDDDSWYLLGRSDDTIKIAGKRLGPAEVESIVVEHPSVVEAAAIGVPDEIKGSSLVVFCVLVPQAEPSSQLSKELRHKVAAGLGKAMAPKEVYFISDLPKTRNAKVMRRILRAAFLDEDPGDLSSLVNPEIIDEIRTIGETKPL